MSNTLTSSPAADVLARLYTNAERSHREHQERLAAVPPEQRPQTTNSREFFAAAKDLYMAVRPDTSRLLYILTRTRRARTIVEFGTSFGVSTLCLAAGLRDNGGGRVIGTEYEPTKAAAARASLAEAGLVDLVEIREGDALETLAGDLPDQVDILFLDGAKEMYLDVVKLVEPNLSPGALLVVDNSNRSPELLAYLRDSEDYLPTAVADDVTVALRTTP
ncbi:O-methyltransferase [Nocardia jiangxiensis]|uniref:O-methyltransferase n=1 Tax=Nocardia jiangxiensis TaxID=282685 RepID=A0ABW6RUJ3_9NOCA|nr:class I SAM-dependent methyltransferase [Nocardia jiangxiensis]